MFPKMPPTTHSHELMIYIYICIYAQKPGASSLEARWCRLSQTPGSPSNHQSPCVPTLSTSLLSDIGPRITRKHGLAQGVSQWLAPFLAEAKTTQRQPAKSRHARQLAKQPLHRSTLLRTNLDTGNHLADLSGKVPLPWCKARNEASNLGSILRYPPVRSCWSFLFDRVAGNTALFKCRSRPRCMIVLPSWLLNWNCTGLIECTCF